MDQAQFKNLLESIIKKHILILGPHITLAILKKINEISIDEKGTVVNIHGSQEQILLKVVTQFLEISRDVAEKVVKETISQDSLYYTPVTLLLEQPEGQEKDKVVKTGNPAEKENRQLSPQSISPVQPISTASSEDGNEKSNIANLDNAKVEEINKLLGNTGG